MTEIKICGITRLDDALAASRFGVDALGFIFHPGSSRYVPPERVKEMTKKLPAGIARVGVFVNHDPCEVARIMAFCGLDLIQLHGDEPREYEGLFPGNLLIRAVSLETEEDLAGLRGSPAKAILVDSRRPGCYGGTGERANWELARRVRETHPLLLAGGLNEENVEEAVRATGADGVDLNSGVEQSPGIKEAGRMRRIIDRIRSLGGKGDPMIFSAFRTGGRGRGDRSIRP
jgi:phosphoribosylanthranilate isomerase